ncbi:hypothetical protein FHG87_004048 [Trinorchestia longiramus]|nr:hypothetical protein FHG87_004048 [Trinorchestia longiramus]
MTLEHNIHNNTLLRCVKYCKTSFILSSYVYINIDMCHLSEHNTLQKREKKREKKERERRKEREEREKERERRERERKREIERKREKDYLKLRLHSSPFKTQGICPVLELCLRARKNDPSPMLGFTNATREPQSLRGTLENDQ